MFYKFRLFCLWTGDEITQCCWRLDYGLINRGTVVRFSAAALVFMFSKTSSHWNLASFLLNRHRGLFPRGLNGRSIKLTDHLHFLDMFRADPHLQSFTWLHGVHTKKYIFYFYSILSYFRLRSPLVYCGCVQFSSDTWQTARQNTQA